MNRSISLGELVGKVPLSLAVESEAQDPGGVACGFVGAL
jgi:hypothetical protein